MGEDPIMFIFTIAVLIMSVVAHEVSHGYAADRLGDPTARFAGRLTLNPIAHLDMVGSFLVPTLMFFFGGFIFWWAKPVPYNPYNMRNPRWGGAMVAVAGPLTNLLIAIVFGLLIRFASVLGLPPETLPVAYLIVVLNLILAVFNLVPIPPLDGSKVLFTLLPHHLYYIQEFLERYSIVILLLLIFFLWRFIFPIISVLFSFITGLGL